MNLGTLGRTLLAAAACAPLAYAQPSVDTAVRVAPATGESPRDSGAKQALDEPDQLQVALAPRSGGLTARSVARSAVSSSPALAAKEAEVRAAAARVDQAFAALAPRITLGASYTRLSPVNNSLGSGAIVGAANPGPLGVGPCPTGAGQCVLDAQGQPVGAAAFSIGATPLNNYALTASVSVPISDYVLRLGSGIAAAKADVKAVRLLKQAEVNKTKADAQLAYFDYARSVGQIAVARHAVTRHRALLKDANTRFTQGTATKADVLRVETLVSQGTLAVSDAEVFERLANEQIGIAIGDPGKNHYLGEDMFAPVRPLPRSASLAALLREANSSRIELAALRESESVLRHSRSATQGGRLPKIDGFFDYTYANPSRNSFVPGGGWGSSWQAGARLSWTINDTFSGGAQAAELDANLQRLRAESSALRNGIRSEVTAAFYHRQKAQRAFQSTIASEASAREALRIARQLYQAGRGTTAEVIDAEHELIAAMSQRLNALIDLRAAKTRLAYAVGRDVASIS